jgi:hypothetical protein
MSLLKFLRLFWSHPMSNLPAESLHEQAATHADATMNAPHGKGQAKFFQRLMPCKDVLVDTIAERAIELEEQRWTLRSLLGHRTGPSSPQIYKGA